MKKTRLLLLLVLLMTAATGAWAQSAFTAKEITSASQLTSTDDEAYVAACMPSDFLAVDADVAKAWTGAPTDGSAILIYAIDGNKIKIATFVNGSYKVTTGATWSIESFKNQLTNGKFYYTAAAPAGYTVSLKDGVKDADKWTISPNPAPEGSPVTIQYTGRLKVKGVTATVEAPAATPTLAEATAEDYGKVVCAAGHLHDAKTAVPDGCTAVGILGKVTETGHGLILALQNSTEQEWETINGWTSVTTYAGTTLKVLPDDAARGSLTSYTKLGETAVSNWAVAQKSDYEAIFENLGSTQSDGFNGTTYDDNVNDYITIGVDGLAILGFYWSATEESDYNESWNFYNYCWTTNRKSTCYNVRPVLGFGGEAAEQAKPAAAVTTAPTGAEIVGVGKTTALVSGGVADGGTLMYAVTTTNTKPTSTDGFSDAVPTAESIKASGTVYVWYYVKGDDTHSDSEIAATAIEVPVADIVWDVTNVTDLGVFEGDPYEKEGVTMSSYSGNVFATWTDNGDPTTDGIAFQAYETGGYTFTAPAGKAFTKIEMNAVGPDGWDSANLGTGWALLGDMSNPPTVTWTGTAASTVGLLTDDGFEGDNVKSIVFYLSE